MSAIARLRVFDLFHRLQIKHRGSIISSIIQDQETLLLSGIHVFSRFFTCFFFFILRSYDQVPTLSVLLCSLFLSINILKTSVPIVKHDYMNLLSFHLLVIINLLASLAIISYFLSISLPSHLTMKQKDLFHDVERDIELQ